MRMMLTNMSLKKDKMNLKRDMNVKSKKRE
jgi:hypothetical protein